MANAQPPVARRIVEAGLQLLEEEGVQALTQTQVAKRSGVRQSHVTYYFPKVTDLLLAIFSASHALAERRLAAPLDPLDAMLLVMFDRERMRFFLKIVAEASAQVELRIILDQHASEWAEKLATFFGRLPDDGDVVSFVDLVRGRAVRHVLEGGLPPDKQDLLLLARRFTLTPVTSR